MDLGTCHPLATIGTVCILRKLDGTKRYVDCVKELMPLFKMYAIVKDCELSSVIYN